MALELNPGLSYDEYFALDDGRRYQVIEGELILTPSPIVRHQELVGIIYQAIASFLALNRCGKVFVAPLDVVLRRERPAVVVQPDVLYVSRERFGILEGHVFGAPDLAIEVLSPATARLDATRKKRLYAQYGVKEYWLVFPDLARIEIYRTQGAAGPFGPPQIFETDGIVTTPLLPGFELTVATFFGIDDDDENFEKD